MRVGRVYRVHITMGWYNVLKVLRITDSEQGNIWYECLGLVGTGVIGKPKDNLLQLDDFYFERSGAIDITDEWEVTQEIKEVLG